MRRIVVALASTVTALVLLFGYHTSLNRPGTVDVVAGSSSSTAQGTDPTATPGTSSASGAAPLADPPPATTTTTSAAQTVTGQSVATRYGPVQVQITVVDGTITDATAVDYPHADSRDRAINARAVPVLEDRTLQVQSAQVDVVSGATYTSQGYALSLQSAIDQAHP